MIRVRLRNDEETQVIDLMTGPLRVMKGWTPKWTSLQQKGLSQPFGYQASSVGYLPVIETLPLIATGCAEAVRQAVRDLETFLEGAAAHHDDPLVSDPHWLEWQSEGEPAKRALVTGGDRQPLAIPDQASRLQDTKLKLTVVLTRHPLWENVTEEADSATALSVVGGMWLWTDTPGTVPARLAVVRFHDNVDGFYGGADNAITTVWSGWRPKYKGLGNFNPIWECETIAAGGDSTFDDGGETVNLVGGTFHNSASAHTVFTDTVLKDRLHISVFDVNGAALTNAKHFAGRYLVLARCWVDSGSAALQLRFGYEGSAGLTTRDAVMIDNTAPHFKELGTIQIPPPGLWPVTATITSDDQCAFATVWLYSQNVDAATLDVDCLVLIPADYFLKLEHASIFSDVGQPLNYTIASCLPNDRNIAYIDETGYVYGGVEGSPNQWYLPAGDSVLVLAAEQAQGQDVDDLLDVDVAWYPRWQSYRE